MVADDKPEETPAAASNESQPKRRRSSPTKKPKTEVVSPPLAPKRARVVRNFPASPFEDALSFAKAVLEYGSGAPVRRVTLFNHLGKSPESGLSRQIITNANKYNLIKGGYQADVLELSPEGKKAADDQIQARERARARVQLAVLDIEPFAGLTIDSNL